MQDITVQEAFRKLSERAASGAVALIDVRTRGEFAMYHARGALNMPTDEVSPEALTRYEEVLVICQSGGRSSRVCQSLGQLSSPHIFNVSGGSSAWEAAGLPVERGEPGKGTISIERQVHIIVGAVVLLGVVLGTTVHSGFVWLSALMGAGLLFAGISDWCGLGLLLARMPWNKSGPSCKCG